MPNLSELSVDQLRRAVAIKEQIENLQSQLNSLNGFGREIPVPFGKGKRRKMSAAGRARIAAAARARWAKVKGTKSEKAAPVAKKKRTMSAAAKAKIAAAAKARWAKAKAAGKKKL